MNAADEIVLKTLEPHMTDYDYAYVVQKVEEAGSVRELTDFSALRQLELAKKTFGGNRSAASSYASNIRWAGKKKEFDSPDREGVKSRTAMMGGIDTQFDVKEIALSDVKTGDIISIGSNRIPQTVTAIGTKDGKIALDTRDLTTDQRFQSVAPAGAVGRIWTPSSQAPSAKTKGSVNPSRLIDDSKISSSDKNYISSGASGPERVRRRGEVIDSYSARGIDVSAPTRSGPKGGAQWLGTMNQ